MSEPDCQSKHEEIKTEIYRYITGVLAESGNSSKLAYKGLEKAIAVSIKGLADGSVARVDVEGLLEAYLDKRSTQSLLADISLRHPDFEANVKKILAELPVDKGETLLGQLFRKHGIWLISLAIAFGAFQVRFASMEDKIKILEANAKELVVHLANDRLAHEKFRSAICNNHPKLRICHE